MRTMSRMPGFLLFFMALAAGCAPQTEVVKLYEDPTRPSGTYKRLLVVDLSSDQTQQRLFENEIALALRREQVEAVASYTLLDASDGLLQEDINRVSNETGADGILITHVVSVDTKIENVPGREEIRSTCRGGDPLDYFLYDHKVLREPDTVKVAQTVIVITNLYDAGSHQRVWTIQSTCFDKTGVADMFLDETNAIVRQLRIDDLI